MKREVKFKEVRDWSSNESPLIALSQYSRANYSSYAYSHRPPRRRRLYCTFASQFDRVLRSISYQVLRRGLSAFGLGSISPFSILLVLVPERIHPKIREEYLFYYSYYWWSLSEVTSSAFCSFSRNSLLPLHISSFLCPCLIVSSH